MRSRVSGNHNPAHLIPKNLGKFLKLIESFQSENGDDLINNININKRDWLGRTLLFYCVMQNKPELIYPLVRAGCNAEIRDVTGKTVVEFAVSRNNFICAKEIVKAGAHKHIIHKNAKKALAIIESQPSETLDHLLSVSNLDSYGYDIAITLIGHCFSGNKSHLITPLIKAGAYINIGDVEKMLVDKKASPCTKELISAWVNVHNKNGGNELLHKSIIRKDEGAVEYLLAIAREGKISIDLSTNNHEGKNALELAEDNGAHSIEKLLLEHGAVPVKVFVRNRKEGIITQGPLSDLPEGMPTPLQVIESVLFPGRDGTKDFFAEKLSSAYQYDVLQPLMQVMALAGLGKHDEGLHNHKQKHFKIIGVPRKELFKAPGTSGGTEGYYRGKNSVFFKLDDVPSVENWSTIMHESTHFVMMEIFKNNANPYRSDDEESKAFMKSVTRITQSRVDSIMKKYEAVESSEEWRVAYFIRNMFKAYNPLTYDMELIVKIPEIMGRIGNECGYKFFQNEMPELIEFYEKHVNPAICKYLKEHNAQQYLILSEQPLIEPVVKPAVNHIETGVVRLNSDRSWEERVSESATTDKLNTSYAEREVAKMKRVGMDGCGCTIS